MKISYNKNLEYKVSTASQRKIKAHIKLEVLSVMLCITIIGSLVASPIISHLTNKYEKLFSGKFLHIDIRRKLFSYQVHTLLNRGMLHLRDIWRVSEMIEEDESIKKFTITTRPNRKGNSRNIVVNCSDIPKRDVEICIAKLIEITQINQPQ